MSNNLRLIILIFRLVLYFFRKEGVKVSACFVNCLRCPYWRRSGNAQSDDFVSYAMPKLSSVREVEIVFCLIKGEVSIVFIFTTKKCDIERVLRPRKIYHNSKIIITRARKLAHTT